MSEDPTNHEKPRQRGRILRFFPEKHYGFIRPNDGGKQCFYHISDVLGDVGSTNGDVVTFTVGEDDRGRSKAKEVTLEANQRPPPLQILMPNLLRRSRATHDQ
jgi:cold shock CspA family protein